MTDVVLQRVQGPHPIFLNVEVASHLEAGLVDRARRLGYGPQDSFMVTLKDNATSQNLRLDNLFIDESLLPPGNGTPNRDPLLQHAEDYERVMAGSIGLNVTLRALRNEVQRLRFATEGLPLCKSCHRYAELLDADGICRRCGGDS